MFDNIYTIFAARIDDGDEGFENDDWQHQSRQSGVMEEVPLRADRWWAEMGPEAGEQDTGRCLGIRCNIWARAQRRREITHNLRGGGSNNRGWGALRWQETIVSNDEVRFGKHRQIKYLAKKIANFLHEFRADDFLSLGLPPLPSDRSRLDVHAMLNPAQIANLLRRLKVSIICSNM